MNIRILSICLLMFLFITSGFSQKAEHLDPEVNSEYEEREPILSPDGKTLYFWRRETPGNTGGLADPGDIWFATQRADGSFTKARRMGPPLNSSGHDFVWQVAPTGDTLWVSQLRQGDPEPGMGYSVKTRENRWSYIQRTRIRGFTYKGKYKDFFLTSQGHMMIPNEGTESEGGTDIYICLKINDTTWAPPINLGPVINTLGDEDAPYLMPDNKTLYFNSNGHNESGQHDIYVTERVGDSWQTWSPPLPIGNPINTASYDFDMVFSPTMEYMYWGSGFNTFGSNDIYRLRLTGCALDVYPGGDHVLCEGEDIRLEAGFTLADRLAFQWQKDGRDIPGANGRDYTITSTGYYRVVRIKDDCRDTSLVQHITFIPSPKVKLTSEETFICDQDSLKLTSLAPDASSWQWIKNGLRIPGAKGPELWVKRHGTYWVSVSNGTCHASSNQIRIGRMEKPIIFPAELAETRSRPRPSEWLWTQDFSNKKEKLIIKDLSAGPLGNSAVLGFKKNGNIFREHLYVFDREGNILWEKPGLILPKPGKRYIDIDYESNVIISSKDKFLRKYNPSGKVLWKIDQRMEDVSGLATDPLGHIFVMGRFKDTLEIGGQRIRPMRRGSAFVAKYDPWGKFLWVKTFSCEWYKYDFGNGLQTDEAGNVYVGGGFEMIAGFGRNQVQRASLWSNNYFLAKYNSEGDLKWSRKFTTNKSRFHTCDMYTDPEGNTYMLLNNKLVKYNSKGLITWRAPLKTPGNTVPRVARITVDGQGTLFTLGITMEKDQYFLSRTGRDGKAILVWEQNNSSKREEHLPALDTNEEGKLFLTAIAGGRAPSRAPIGGPAFITSFGQPEPENELDPLALCPGESVLLQARVLAGLPFYWLKNGTPIPGATDSMLTVTETGTYQVRTFSGECERYSNSQEINDCYQALAGNLPKKEKEPVKTVPPVVQGPVIVKKPAPEPEPTPQPTKVPNDLQTTNAGVPKRLNGRRITSQNSVTITNPKVTLYVWDHGAVDNDTISLNVNGTWLLQEFPLRRAKMEVEVTFKPGEKNFIILYAHNLGGVPPNTASLQVDDGVNRQTLKLRSNLKSCGSVDVKLE